jgi:Xaa-Pro aminopeptidase
MLLNAKAIPVDEYFLRLAKLRARMHEADLAAVLLGTGMNLQYLCGLPSPERNVARPFFLLIPLHGNLMLFCHTALEEESRRAACVGEIRTYPGLSRVPITLLRDAIADIGAATGRIGMELGYEQSLDISPLELQRLHAAVPAAEWIDVADMLWTMRMIKSENEIACLRESCQIVAAAYRHTFATARAGMTERQIYDVMLARLQSGGTEVFLVITSGVGNYDLISKRADERVIETGDMVWMDAGCRVAGYWSDYSRAGVAGQPTDLQKQVQVEVATITKDAVAHIRPGVRCSDVARYALARLGELPVAVTSSLAERAGRVGHGIGLTMTEPPHLGVHDDTVFAPGMAITVEPGIATEFGTFHVEENVVVRDGPCELLSSAPRILSPLGHPLH